MDNYPDAPARLEMLIDLCMWAALASRSFLETGQVLRVVCARVGVCIG